MFISDIMTKKVISVNEDASITEVANLLTHHAIHALPVVNKKNEVIGIIAETDLFIKNMPSLYLPSYIDFIKNIKFVKGEKNRAKKVNHQLLGARAKDIMTKRCITVSPKLLVTKFIKQIKIKKLYSVPVVKGKKLVGIVTVADIIKLISCDKF